MKKIFLMLMLSSTFPIIADELSDAIIQTDPNKVKMLLSQEPPVIINDRLIMLAQDIMKLRENEKLSYGLFSSSPNEKKFAPFYLLWWILSAVALYKTIGTKYDFAWSIIPKVHLGGVAQMIFIQMQIDHKLLTQMHTQAILIKDMLLKYKDTSADSQQ